MAEHLENGFKKSLVELEELKQQNETFKCVFKIDRKLTIYINKEDR